MDTTTTDTPPPIDQVFNFAAGPATLPHSLLKDISSDILHFNGSPLSLLEISHRSKEFVQILESAQQNLRTVLDIPDEYEVLFMHGGATMQFSAIPLNLCSNTAGFVTTGIWSRSAVKESKNYSKCEVIYDHDSSKPFPTEIQPPTETIDYVYTCHNETVNGVRIPYPIHLIQGDNRIPVIADMSSSILTEKINISDYDLIFAGAQKNLGVAGVTIVIIKKSLLKPRQNSCPILLSYLEIAKKKSNLNTPSTFAYYVLDKMIKWVMSHGGVSAMEQKAIKSSQQLYSIIDSNPDFFISKIHPSCRSRINIVFNLPTPELEAEFLKEAKLAGLVSLAGHRSVGGIRASIYNAMPVEGIEKLAAFMKSFHSKHVTTN